MNSDCDILRFFKRNTPSLFFFVCLLFLAIHGGCQILSSKVESSHEDCIDQINLQLEKLPEKKYLITLDDQKVDLQEFFEKCSRNQPYCVLNPKFYYWRNEIRVIESNSETGMVQHKIRMYYNILSTCYPKKEDTGRTHGDVVEFYDTEGIFMGLGVYMGKGLYWPLPYSKYKGKKRMFF
jgi:hypothetical protein